MLRMSLEVAMDAGYLARQPTRPLAHFLLGALNEAALAIAREDDTKKARREVGSAVARLVDGLKTRA